MTVVGRMMMKTERNDCLDFETGSYRSFGLAVSFSVLLISRSSTPKGASNNRIE
jgi:hypothetical protein